MPDNSANNKRIAKNSIFLSIRMVIVLGISLYTTRAVLDVLGVVDYGVQNVVCGFVAMFAFLNTSMSNGIQRFFNFELGRNGEEGANKVYCTAIIIQFILAVIIIVLTETFGLWYLHNKMVIPPERFIAAQWIFQFSVISFLFVIMQAPYTAAVMAHERMDFYAFVSVLDAVLKLIIVLALPFLQGDKLIIYGLLLLVISVTNFLLYAVYARLRFREIRFHRFFDRQLFRSMLGFSGWNLFGSFSGVMKEYGINLIINLFFGPVVNAARGVAAQVNSGLQGFVSNITTPVRPQIVQSYARGEVDRTMNLTYSISKLSCCFFYMLALPIMLEIDYILHLWLGENVPEHTSTFIIIVIATTFIAYLNSAVSAVVHASGQMKKYQLTTGLIGLASVPVAYGVLSLGAAPEYALLVTFLSKAIAQFFSVLILMQIVRFTFRDYLREVIYPLIIVIVCSSIFPLFPRTFMDESFCRLCVVCLTDVIAIALITYYFALNMSEKLLIRQLMSTINKRIRR